MKFNFCCNADKKSPESTLFSAAQCDELFAAVLVHDELYPKAKLPDEIHLDYSQEQLAQCYRLCQQLWLDGVDRTQLCLMIEKIYKQGFLSAEDKITYHAMRAKIKHLRFAYVTFDERHRYPTMFHWMTGVMGNLQDAFKHDQRSALVCSALLVRFLLTKPFYTLITKEMDCFQPSTPESFCRYVHDEINFIRLHLTKNVITGKEFHEMRKVISRQVAMYDNLKTLYPSSYHRSISEYLSTINGLMGSKHDELIAKKFDKSQDYYTDTFVMPEEIKQRLIDLADKYNNPIRSSLI
ncbi:MAG: hypothetical protein NTU92_08145 [Methylotenera sp.]|nr:hypothetical protein [Methylotenera sp.]